MADVPAPVQLDRDVVYKERTPSCRTDGSRRKKGLPIFAGAALLASAVLLLYSPDNTGFVETPPPEEQTERDSVAAVAERVTLILENGGTADHSSLNLPAEYIFTMETDSLWSLETPGGLYYTSDMNIQDFRTGDI